MVLVTVEEGTLEGGLLFDDYGGKIYSFKGIPYAQPPVGDLRFKAPKKPNRWPGVRSAKEFGSVCTQANVDLQPEPIGSEDCLYLNVYTPDLTPNSPLPVMVFIHGGGFTFGSGNDDWCDPDYLVRQGVIFVSFNYRLEVLGFLCLDTEDVPGNAGMKDQVEALRWVQRNITKFGGDPRNVTIFGMSAGAASVTYHLVSPMSKGLFKRAIVQSGTNTCYWSEAFAPRERALAVAKSLGFQSEDDKELYEFFKTQPAELLTKMYVSVTYLETYKEFWRMYFGVVSEKQFGDNERFFFGNIYNVLRDNIHDGVEVVVGYTSHEGILNLTIDNDKMFSQANKFTEYFVPTHIALNCPLDNQLEVGRRMKNWHFKSNNIGKDDTEEMIQYLSLDTFVYPIIEWAKMYASSDKNKVYLYRFSCKSERNIFVDLLGIGKLLNGIKVTSHADDAAYIFRMRSLTEKVDLNSKTFKLIDNVTKLWTNFARCGNPTPDDSLGVQWIPFSLEKQEYLDIGNTLVESNGPEKKDIDFWESIYEEFLPQRVHSSYTQKKNIKDLEDYA